MRPVVVILGPRGEPPPGIKGAEAFADLRFADSLNEIRDALPGADALFFWHASRRDLEEAWDAADQLRWIQTASDGVDGLLFPALISSETLVTNGRGIFEDAIAEWVIGVLLGFATRIPQSFAAQRQHRWISGETERLAGSSLLVVGPGPIGRAVATRAGALGMEIAAVGRTAREDDLFGRVRPVGELADAVADADVVVDTLPITLETHHLFDARIFSAMRPTARFVNVGRGATVDEPALIRALQKREIAGAALDVFETEPLAADSPLWDLPGVIISPHMCGDFEGWEEMAVDLFLDNLARFARGETLRNPVDKHAGFGAG
ncbi:MAG: D-2-hydroxyacid dehydrogenase [Actinomycetota bacterium]